MSYYQQISFSWWYCLSCIHDVWLGDHISTTWEVYQRSSDVRGTFPAPIVVHEIPLFSLCWCVEIPQRRPKDFAHVNQTLFPSLMMLGSGDETTHACTAGYNSASHDSHCKLHGVNVIGVSESETNPRKCLMYTRPFPPWGQGLGTRL